MSEEKQYIIIPKAISVHEAEKRRFNEVPFEGKWKDSFGTPALTGSWIIWADSGNGKTRLALQLCKYLTTFADVLYNTFEEGMSRTFQKAISETGMNQVSVKFKILEREELDVLKARLRKRRSADVVVIDSLQYMDITKHKYKALKKEFPNKLFIYISHAEGKQPEGRLAKFIRYDSDIKMRVEGYTTSPVSRYGGGQPYVIWEKGADKYYNNEYSVISK